MTAPALRLLRDAEFLPALSRFRRQSRVENARAAGFGLLGLGFLALLYGFFKQVLLFFYRQDAIGPVLVYRVLHLAFTAFFALLLVSNLISLLSSLYLAEDADFLLSTPLSPRAYFRFKFAQAGASSSWMVLALWIPLLLALWQARHLGAWFLAFGLLAPVPLCLIATSLSAAGLQALLRFADAARLRRLLVFLAAAAGCGFLLLLRLMQPEQLSNPNTAMDPSAYLAILGQGAPAWLPSAWIADGVAFYAIHPARALASLGWAFLAAGLLCPAALWLGGRSFHSTWLSSRSGAGEGRSRGTAFFWRRTRGRAASLWVKDLALLLREPSSQVQFLICGFLMALYFYSLYKASQGYLASLSSFLFGLSCVFSAFINDVVAMRFVFPATSMEGDGLVILRSSPLKMRHYLAGKFWTALALLAAFSLGEWFFARSIFHPQPGPLALGTVVLAGSCLGLAALQAGLGAAWARPDVDRPDEMVTTFAGALLMVFSSCLILALAGLMILPARELDRLSMSSRFTAHAWIFWVCGSLAAAAVATAVWIPLRMGREALENPKG